MHSRIKQLLSAFVISTAIFTLPLTHAQATQNGATIKEGMKLAYSRAKGNCLACHKAGEGTMPGTIGPALIAMKLRYPDKQKLFDKIWGKPHTLVPNSMMPAFGAHGILSDEEINKVVDYIYTL